MSALQRRLIGRIKAEPRVPFSVVVRDGGCLWGQGPYEQKGSQWLQGVEVERARTAGERRDVSSCATRDQKQLCERAKGEIAGTHSPSCSGVRTPFPTYSAIDWSLVFDHGKSVAGARMITAIHQIQVAV